MAQAPKSASPKVVKRAWSLYDWANSVYNLVITTTIFPIYYLSVSKGADGSDVVDFFGWKVINSALLNYALAFAYLIIAFLSPILSSIADYKGNKKHFMQGFTLLGGLACCGLYFFYPAQIGLGIGLSILAAIGYCGSLVFYNAYLPEIAKPGEQDRLSAQGFAFGYVGSVLLQLICLGLVLYPFEDRTFAPRLSFLLVGLWWLGFAQISFYYLPSGNRTLKTQLKSDWLKGGFRELKKVATELRHQPLLKRFLPAFFFYSMGVQTVMLAASEFGSKEILKREEDAWVAVTASDLIPIILLIQLVAIPGAYTMAALIKRIGHLRVLILAVFFWIGICACAYFIHHLSEFYLLAIAVGFVMGGIQSMSRSTYAHFMPPTKDTTSYFSFYDVMEKLSIVCGMFVFAFLEDFTGNMRISIIALILFFVLGFLLLLLARKQELNHANSISQRHE